MPRDDRWRHASARMHGDRGGGDDDRERFGGGGGYCMNVASGSIETDIAVIGGGPCGIAAAACAAERGRRVLLLDSAPRIGGQIWRHRDPRSLPRAARRWMERLDRSGATVDCGATVVD